MFVYTRHKGLVNLNCYPFVDVIKSKDDKWLLQAFTQAESERNWLRQDFTQADVVLAVFDEEVEARYNLYCLYRALEVGETVWDPCKVHSFLRLWDAIKEYFVDDYNRPPLHIPPPVLDALTLKITGLREITIEYPYGDRQLSITPDAKQAFEKKFKEKLQSVEPMRGDVVWKIKWQDIG